MMTTKLFLAITCIGLIASSACSDDPEPLTWGTVSQEVSEGFCDSLFMCSTSAPPEEGAIERCVDHSVFHLCELDDTCGVTLVADAGVLLDDCMSAFAALEPGTSECGLLAFYGVVPEACLPVLALKPDPQ